MVLMTQEITSHLYRANFIQTLDNMVVDTGVSIEPALQNTNKEVATFSFVKCTFDSNLAQLGPAIYTLDLLSQMVLSQPLISTQLQ